MASSFVYERKERLLTVSNVSVTIKGNPILKDVNAHIDNLVRPGMQQGQVVALLGPSGVGKTTLFRVLSGLMKPTSGLVLVGGNQERVRPGMVGVVHQNYPLLPHRTVMGNLLYAGRQAKVSAEEAKQKANEFLTEFSLEDHAEKYPIQLSGGQRQRVAIAQQLLCSQHYLVMDEPFSGLDVVALAKARNQILKAATANEENTIIVVTHDVTTAVSIADTIWLMGRDYNVKGKPIPGARIMEVIDLVEQNICWHDDPLSAVGASDLVRRIKESFFQL